MRMDMHPHNNSYLYVHVAPNPTLNKSWSDPKPALKKS